MRKKEQKTDAFDATRNRNIDYSYRKNLKKSRHDREMKGRAFDPAFSNNN